MKVGIPSEVKNNEFRVGITPVGVHELVRRGHDVFVQRGAGLGSSITDEQYVSQGAKILDSADDVWGEADMVMKVKEPVAEEYHRLREGLVLFTYLHLAADEPLTKELVDEQGHLASPTRRCSCPRACCRCSTRCPRSPGASPPRSGRTR